MGILHDYIISRANGSDPGSDMAQLGFNPDELYDELLQNENMTVEMVAAMSVPPQPPQYVLAKYAMTWLGIGMGLYKEKRDRSDDIPTLPTEPDG